MKEFWRRILCYLRLSRRVTVALPMEHLGWLDIDAAQVSDMLSRVGITTLHFDSECVNYEAVDEKFCWPPLLNDALHYAVCVESESVAVDVEAMFPVITAVWRTKLAKMYAITKTHFQTHTPDLVVLVQGHEPTNAVARAVAIELGVPLLALENTALSGRMLWDDVSGVTTNRNLAKNYYWKYKHSISPDTLKAFDRDVVQILRMHKLSDHVAPKKSLDIPDDKPIALFLGQVFTDSSLVFGLLGWDSPLDILAKLASWCRDNEYRLVIKLHPKEASGIDPIKQQAYNRLTYRKINNDASLCELLHADDVLIDADNIYDTYALIESCSFAVTVNSQSGLEATLLGKAVVVCGDSFYSGLGFTLDAAVPKLFEHQLDQAREAEHKSGALEFAYIFFEHYCRPKTMESLVKLIRQSCRTSA